MIKVTITYSCKKCGSKMVVSADGDDADILSRQFVKAHDDPRHGLIVTTNQGSSTKTQESGSEANGG